MNLEALRSANFRTYLLGSFFAINAIWIFRIALAWLAWDLTGSGTFTGIVAFLSSAPSMIFSPFFGVLVDRVNVRTAGLITQFAMLCVTLLTALLLSLDAMTNLLLAIVAFASGTVVSAHHPVRLSMAPRLVDREHVPSVVNLTAINFNLARTISPALGGLAMAHLGIAATLWLVTLFISPFLLAIWLLHIRPLDTPTDRKTSYFVSLQQGFLHMLDDGLMRRAMMLTFLTAFTIRGLLDILPIVADGLYERGVEGFGLLASAAGAGALLAGVAKAIARPQTGRHIPLLLYIIALISLGCLPLMASFQSWNGALIIAMVSGFGATFVAVSLQTTIQQNLEDHLRGRVMSLWIVVAVGGTALGATTLGLASDVIGFQTTMWTATCLALLSLLVIFMRSR